MNDLEQAQAYLNRDKLRYMDMLELLRRGSADVLRVWDDGVLLHDATSGAWVTAADSASTLDEMLAVLPEGVDFFVGHDLELRDWVVKRLGLQGGFRCYQAAWLHEQPPELPPDAPAMIRLGAEWAEYLHKCYSHSFAGVEYMHGALKRGVLGVFQGETLAGFIGFHDEGTIGMLEVLPQFRRQGLGELLTLGAIRLALSEGRYAFGQVIEGNEPSFALQRKVGMTICETPMYWLP